MDGPGPFGPGKPPRVNLAALGQAPRPIAAKPESPAGQHQQLVELGQIALEKILENKKPGKSG